MKVKMSSIHAGRQPWRNLGIALLIGCSASGIPIENVSPDAPSVQSGSPLALGGAIIRTVAGGRAPTGNARSSIYGTSSVVARGGAVYQ